ncbi:DUF3486 family protein [Desulfovibrio sp. OttesenSCG-928-C14]|nr:DUF3486 family protein [Desulfovibrio sp. OttesenSCG-928-C14]
MGGVQQFRHLPREVRDLVFELFDNGCTIDEVTASLRELGAKVSRSAVGRQRLEWQQVVAHSRQAREAAQVLLGSFKDSASSDLAQANLEMLHVLILRFLRAESAKEAVTLKPNELMFLTKALQGLTGARRQEVDTAITAEQAVQEKAAETGEGGQGFEIHFMKAGPQHTPGGPAENAEEAEAGEDSGAESETEEAEDDGSGNSGPETA